jgi:hypothetical protein
VVYASEIDKKKFTFQVSGKLWNRSLVMRDIETGSLWSHILGECMDGELKGKKLDLIPSVMSTWKEWLAANPDTTVLDMRPTADRFGKGFYRSAKKFVYGVKVNGSPKAYSFPFLKDNPIVQEAVGGVPVLITFDPESTAAMIFNRGARKFKPELEGGRLIEVPTGASFDPLTGIGDRGEDLPQLNGIISYRKAWLVFYPESTVAEVPTSVR